MITDVLTATVLVILKFKFLKMSLRFSPRSFSNFVANYVISNLGKKAPRSSTDKAPKVLQLLKIYTCAYSSLFSWYFLL